MRRTCLVGAPVGERLDLVGESVLVQQRDERVEPCVGGGLVESGRVLDQI
ncbi:MAG: hypothetical protein VX427_16230 [Acidobacteriota bacterium]|nr:hypothetical protein [Acidobacteriota bacterium]